MTAPRKHTGRLPWWLHAWVRGILVAPLVLGWLWLGTPPIGLKEKVGITVGVAAWLALMLFVRHRTRRKLDQLEASANAK